jgi:hypothetical protein
MVAAMSILNQESKLEFQLGGPAYRLMQRIGLIRGEGPCLGRRMMGFVLITWVPLLILALIEGQALGPTPRESFLLDFSTYARFFLAVPLLFLSEVIVGPRIQAAGWHFVRADLVRPEDHPVRRGGHPPGLATPGGASAGVAHAGLGSGRGLATDHGNLDRRRRVTSPGGPA